MHNLLESISRRLEKLLKVPVVSQPEGDVEKRLALKIGQQSAAVLVSFKGLTPEVQSASNFIGKAEVVVSVYEKPIVNRSKDEGKGRHLLDIAEDVRRALTYFTPEGAASSLFYRSTSAISEVNAEIGDVIVCDVAFDLKTR